MVTFFNQMKDKAFRMLEQEHKDAESTRSREIQLKNK